jgi:acetyl esterase/lipase
MPTTTTEARASTEAPDAAGVYKIYPGDGLPPGMAATYAERTMVDPWQPSNGRRMVRNVAVPTITWFKPAADKANGTALIIAPGGAFHFLMVDHEGYDMARALLDVGVTSFVLKYRVQPMPERDEDVEAFRADLNARLRAAREFDAPGNVTITRQGREWGEDDGRQAIRYVREHAKEFGVDPGRIGIAGFSAGGGVAMGPTLEHDAASRPDFTCAVYPAARSDFTVPDDAPPLFIIISDDDPSVPPALSARLYQEWHRKRRPAELHVFGNGGHGWGMGQDGHLSDIWMSLFKNWLKARGLLGPRSNGA